MARRGSDFVALDTTGFAGVGADGSPVVHSVEPVAGSGLAGTRGRTIRLVVRVRARQEVREVEPAEDVPKEQRGVVWARWLAEGRYRSGAELARAAGVSRETVSAAVRGKG